MPDVSVTDEQFERLAELRTELAASQTGPYATVNPTDVIEYLLDLSEVADDEVLLDAEAERPEVDVDHVSESTAESETEADASGGDEGGDGGVFDLLERHEGKWREGGGEEPYEVDLPDGGTETARTRDDVKAVLFENYR